MERKYQCSGLGPNVGIKNISKSDKRVKSCVSGGGGGTSGLTAAATRPQTFMLRAKAVGVAATATIPEGRACIDVFVKEPELDIIPTLDTSINLQLTLGCKQNTHVYDKRTAGRRHRSSLKSRSTHLKETSHICRTTTCSLPTFPTFQTSAKRGERSKRLNSLFTAKGVSIYHLNYGTSITHNAACLLWGETVDRILFMNLPVFLSLTAFFSALASVLACYHYGCPRL